MDSKTSDSGKTLILADVWMSYRNDAGFSEFIEYNDMGLPLAYAIANDIVETTPMAKMFITETFESLMEHFGFEEDTGFDDIDEILALAEDYLTPVVKDIEEVETESYEDGHELGYTSGVLAERERTQEIVKMHMRWAEEQNKGRDYMFWKAVGEVLTPIEIEPMTDEKWKEELEKDGF